MKYMFMLLETIAKDKGLMLYGFLFFIFPVIVMSLGVLGLCLKYNSLYPLISILFVVIYYITETNRV